MTDGHDLSDFRASDIIKLTDVVDIDQIADLDLQSQQITPGNEKRNTDLAALNK